MRPGRRLLLVGLAALFLVPPAGAQLVPAHDFGGGVSGILDFARGNQSKDFLLFTGQADATGSDHGLFGIIRADAATITGVPRVEVYDTSGNQSSIDPKEFVATRRPVHMAFHDATIALPYNTTFFLLSETTTFEFAAAAPFAVGLPFLPPQDIGGRHVDFDADRSLALVGRGASLQASMNSDGDTSALVYVTNNATVTISNETTTETFNETRYVYKIFTRAELTGLGLGVFVPFQGNGTAAFKPAVARILKDRFDLSELNVVAQQLGSTSGTNGTREVVPRDVAANLGAVAPLLNGAMVGSLNGTFEFAGHDRAPGSFTLVRYSRLSLVATESGNILFEGRGRFLLVGDSLVSTQSTVNLGLFDAPVLSLFLWLFAAVAIVLGYTLKPLVRPDQVSAWGSIRILGWVIHGLGLLLMFLLWDAETKALLGTSLLTLFVQGAFGEAVALSIVGAFELIPLLLAAGLFGLPLRFIVNSALKLGGLKRAKGVGKGVGNLATWGLGAPFIPVFINVVVGALLKGIGSAF